MDEISLPIGAQTSLGGAEMRQENGNERRCDAELDRRSVVVGRNAARSAATAQASSGVTPKAEGIVPSHERKIKGFLVSSFGLSASCDRWG